MATEVDLLGKTGPSMNSDGSKPMLRIGKTGEMIVGEAGLGKYFESMSRKRSFSANLANGGVAPGEAFTTAPPLIVYNPANSGVVLSCLNVGAGYRSGTYGAGTLAIGFGATAVPSGGTALTVRATDGGGQTGSAKAYTGSTITAMTGAYMLGSFNAVLASTATVAPMSCNFDVAGAVGAVPGSAYTVEGYYATAGTSPLAVMSSIWSEIPII